MKSHFRLATGLVLSLLILAASVDAAVPQEVNYRGRLVDASGSSVADGNYLLKFAVYDSETGGTELWNSGFQLVHVTGGVFSYSLGAKVALPTDLFSSGSSRYLGITVGTESEITPRTRFVSSAYAHKSGDADMLDGIDGADLALKSHTHVLNSSAIDDEPGIAYDFHLLPNPRVLSTTIKAYDTVTFVAPSSGYVVLIGNAQINMNHTLGRTETVVISVSRSPTSIDFDNSGIRRMSSSTPTTTNDMIFTFSCTRVEAVAAGTNTYYLTAMRESSGIDQDIVRLHLTAMYFPTAYGPVAVPVSPGSGGDQILAK